MAVDVPNVGLAFVHVDLIAALHKEQGVHCFVCRRRRVKEWVDRVHSIVLGLRLLFLRRRYKEWVHPR